MNQYQNYNYNNLGQPYMNNANPYYMALAQTQNNSAINTTNTNKIYVNGIDNVRNWALTANSDYLFLDNDKPIIYQKIVDSKGQFEVKAFKIIPMDTPEDTTLSEYVKKKDLEPLQLELEKIKEKLSNQIQMEVKNGTGTTKQI